MRLFKAITLALIGSTLSIALQACAHRPDHAPPAAIAVKIEDIPPAELTACPSRPAGFPADASATMPAEVRAATIRLARAYAALADQTTRLVDWITPGACDDNDGR